MNKQCSFIGAGAAATLAACAVVRRYQQDRIRERRRPAPRPETSMAPGVYLYWLPLGAGAWVVRMSGAAFEAITARLQGRPRRDLYHSALEVVNSDATFVIEMTPVTDRDGQARGVVAEGAVGSRWARPCRVFRYEIRRWRDGVIPDVLCAIESPVRVSAEVAVAQQVLDLVPLVSTPVWGRAESVVNLVAAVVVLVVLRVAARPADERHHYGHSKAEYLSAGAEGTMILVAAAAIVASATGRLLHPRPLEHIGPGLVVRSLGSWSMRQIALLDVVGMSCSSRRRSLTCS